MPLLRSCNSHGISLGGGILGSDQYCNCVGTDDKADSPGRRATGNCYGIDSHGGMAFIHCRRDSDRAHAVDHTIGVADGSRSKGRGERTRTDGKVTQS